MKKLLFIIFVFSFVVLPVSSYASVLTSILHPGYLTKGEIVLDKTANLFDSLSSFFSSLFGSRDAATTTKIVKEAAINTPSQPSYVAPVKHTYVQPVQTKLVVVTPVTPSATPEIVTNTVYIPADSNSVPYSDFAALEERVASLEAKPSNNGAIAYITSSTPSPVVFNGLVSQSDIQNIQNQINSVSAGATTYNQSLNTTNSPTFAAVTAGTFYGDGSHLTGISAGSSFSTSTTRSVFSASSPLTYNSTTGAFGVTQSSTSTAGYLSSADFTAFNNKVSSPWLTNGSSVYYNGGNVGIGTTTPSHALDVAGDINFTGNLFQNGIAFSAGGSGNVNSGLAGQVAVYNANGTAVSGTSSLSFSGGNGYFSGSVQSNGLIVPGANGSVPGISFNSPGGTNTFGSNLGIALDSGFNIAASIGNYGDFRVDSQAGTVFRADKNGNIFANGNATISGTGNSSFAGNVGIGTTNPASTLDVNGLITARGGINLAGTGNTIFFNSVGDSADVIYNAGLQTYISGYQGIKFISYPNGGQSTVAQFGSGSDMNAIFYGNVGIGTTTPSAQLTTTGTVQFANFGAGTLQTDANGNVTVSSDERLKNITGNFDKGLSDIMKINPISYNWKASTGYDTQTTYTGFSAQNIQSAIPEAVGLDKQGFLTLQDRPIIAALVNAVKEIGGMVDHVEGAVTYLKNITVTHFSVGTSSNPEGITMYSSSGSAFCLTISDSGTPQSQAGACGSGSTAPVQSYVAQPVPIVTLPSTEASVSVDVSTSTATTTTATDSSSTDTSNSTSTSIQSAASPTTE